MLDTYIKLRDLLDKRERKLALMVFFLMFSVALVEVLGVASILPFIAVLSNPDVVDTNKYLAAVYNTLDFTSKDSFMLFLGVCVFVILVVSLLLKAIGFWASFHYANMRNHSLGCKLLAGYLRQPYCWFLNKNSTEFAANILQDVGRLVHGSLFPAMQVISQGLVALFLMGLLVIVDPVLACVIALLLGGAYSIIFMLVKKHLTGKGRAVREGNLLRFRIINELFSAIKEVKLLGLEEVLTERFREPSARMAKDGANVKVISELPSFAMQALIFGGMLLVLLYLITTKGGLDKALPFIALYALAGYKLMPSVQAIYKHITDIRYTQPLLNAIHKDRGLIIYGSESNLEDCSQSVPDLINKLDLVDINYTYPGAHQPSLRGITLSIPAKTTTGLVGSTGAGKTTIVDIILGLLIPDSGELCVDGVSVSNNNIRSWQNKLGYVPQQIYLTDDTVAANIAFGIADDKINMPNIERAARAASLHDFVVSNLPDGYETIVGESGVRLSGGQRQRIGIARALYHDPDVLILDEATSALDNLTEKEVMNAVHVMGNRKTIIIIAHRLSTVQNCDRIFLLDHGRIVESGTFDELFEHSSLFREMASTDD